MARLYLASASPRRAELLRQLGVPFRHLLPPDIDETPRLQESPADYVIRMAAEKAAVGVATRPEGGHEALVLGADTSVVLDESILGKPEDRAQAVAMLTAMSGREHRVISAVCVSNGQQLWQAISETHVTFRALSRDEILRYVDTGEGADKAGGYGIQGFGAALVERLAGSYSGVVGLPLAETSQLLEAAGIRIWQTPEA